MCAAPLAAQIGKHKRRVQELEGLRELTFACTEESEFVEVPVNRFVKVAWFSSLVLYWCPGATGAVDIIEGTVETRVVTKTRPLVGPYMYAVGGVDGEGNELSSVERYDEGKDEWEAVASMGRRRAFVGVASDPSTSSTSSSSHSAPSALSLDLD